jgi:GAF domain-containing protein/anti-sigma regulatory factor (Ser/Thr protein kinase)
VRKRFNASVTLVARSSASVAKGGANRVERSPATQYGFAAAVTTIGLASTALLLPATETITYSPLLGAVALSVWYGGLGPALAATVVSWPIALVALTEPYFTLDQDGETLARWAVSLLVALAITAVAWWMRRGRERAAVAAGKAERRRASVEHLHGIASTLSTAAAPEDVARALVEGARSALGATRVEMGVVEDSTLRLLGADERDRDTPLSARTVIATAAREGRECWVDEPRMLEREFPDNAVSSASGSLMGLPLVARGTVVGALSIAFDSAHDVPEEERALMRLVADMGGSALERASLYADERESRTKLEEILTVSPRFGRAGTALEIAADICRLARETFDAEAAQVWRAGDDGAFEVVWREPPHAAVVPGSTIDANDRPGLREAMEELRVMFVPDMLDSVRGDALALVREIGVRSALRIPIVVGGRAAHVLDLAWDRVVPEPDSSFVALARRFADQGGLAIEQAERRRAQERAGHRAVETRRLLDLTATLAAAATIEEVATAVIDQSEQSLGARAAVVVRRLEHEGELEIVGARRFDPELVERWRRIPLAAEVPLCDAVRDSRTVALASIAERDAHYPALAREPVTSGHGAWLAFPLSVESTAIGGVALAFSGPRSFSLSDLDFVDSLARQAGQAFERARLLDAEHEARERAERIAASLAQLHALGTSLSRAVSAREIAAAVASHIVAVLDARSAEVYVVALDGSGLELRGSAGEEGQQKADRPLPFDARTPATEVVRTGAPVWVERADDWLRYPDADAALAGGGITLGAVPMLVDEGPLGAVCVTFDGGRAVDAEQRRFVETISRQAAQPFDRVRLLESERRSRRRAEQATERTRRLQRVTDRLAAASSLAEVGDVTVREGLAAVAGDSALLYVVGSDGTLHLLAAHGYSADTLGGFRRLARDADEPVADVVRRAELLVLESDAAVAERYPRARGRGGAPPSSLLCAPLVVGRTVVGALELTSHRARHFDEADRLVSLTLARQCAQALERARLYDAETAAAGRARRLQEVTASLSQAATPEAVGSACLEQAIAAVGARAGVIATIAPEGDVLTVAGALGYDDRAWAGVRLDDESPLAEPARTGQPLWALTPEEAARFALAAPAPTGGEAGDAAWAALPLVGRGGTLGTLLLGFAAPPQLAAEDRDWLEVLAGQCSQALDRSRLYEDERATRRRSERLQALTSALSSSLTTGDVASVFLEQSAAALAADGSSLALVDDTGEALRPLVRAGRGDEATVRERSAIPVDTEHPVTEAFRRRRTIALASRQELLAAYPDLEEWSTKHDAEAVVVSPLVVSGGPLGVVAFTWSDARRLSADERAFVATLTSQCAQALDRARRYEQERTIAETLQRSVLPERLPDIAGLDLAARYLAGSSGVAVGGDWFDVIELENGRVALVVGDVVGKGVEAAATMGQLRNALRAFAFEQLKPASAVARLNRLADTLVDSPFATIAFMTIDPAARVCRYTLAGHPAPIVRRPNGEAVFLEEGRSLPVGVGVDVSYAQGVSELEPGSTVLLFTDGLVERRDRSLEDGLGLLRSVVDAGPSEPGALVEHVLAELLPGEERGDDVAVLAVRLTEVPLDIRLVLPAEPAALSTVRERLRPWLAKAGASAAETDDIVLAAWEACANAIEHAQEPTLPDFAFEASRVADRVRVAVRDHGRWKPEVPRAHRGFGLRLMRTLMESVEVSPVPHGTVVTMERRVGTGGGQP